MPKVSRDTAQVAEFGAVEDRHDEIDGYSVNFVSFRQDADAAPLLKGLPDDRCSCPHWGYVFKGRMTFDLGDREEVFDAGDAFYVPAGHVPKVEAGTEIVQFSPAADLHLVEAAMAENMKRLART